MLIQATPNFYLRQQANKRNSSLLSCVLAIPKLLSARRDGCCCYCCCLALEAGNDAVAERNGERRMEDKAEQINHTLIGAKNVLALAYLYLTSKAL